MHSPICPLSHGSLGPLLLLINDFTLINLIMPVSCSQAAGLGSGWLTWFGVVALIEHDDFVFLTQLGGVTGEKHVKTPTHDHFFS
jgi:hypothetical protein